MGRLRTYISLFSSAGVGCYAFKKNGFKCVATNELLERRLQIQRINHKCEYDSGYIGGDITLEETQSLILDEIERWTAHRGMKQLDVLMATPPCQGMSTANYKKGNEIERNSLVVEAIHLVNRIKPRVFIFENVRAFLSTMCVDKDDEILSIKDCINKNLLSEYNIYSKVVNFMDYGIPSSRPRTLVIGTRKNEKNFSPLNLFPLKSQPITLRQAIGDLESLNYGERSSKDIYHSFRKYPQYMQEWIHDLKEGETAFNNVEEKIPYKIVNGEKHILKSGHMGNKFRRMFWESPAPCITTRNDQLASQTTIHPSDDRVLSIRELMRVMGIPDDFKWVEIESESCVDSNETLIRQSIGEAVPTGVIAQIAKNINTLLEYDDFVREYSEQSDLSFYDKSDNYYIKSFIYEKQLSNSKETGSFYTPQIVVYNTIKDFKPQKKIIKVLEPSVGVGAFIPQFIRLVDDCEKVEFDLVDISEENLSFLRKLIKPVIKKYNLSFNFICDDFIMHSFNSKYDAIISNPPYFKLKPEQRKRYGHIGCSSENIFCLFLDKYTLLSDEIMCVIPKNFLMIPDSNTVRLKYEKDYRVRSIYDYGVNFFKEVFIEIISIHFTKESIVSTYIENIKESINRTVGFDYIYHDKMWLIYRDKWFDEYISTLNLDVFDFYRDRQLTNKYLKKEKDKIWVIRSKNLVKGGKIEHIDGYDRFIHSLDGFVLKKYYGEKQIVFVNFTYNTRAAILPKNCTVNGSLCILLPKYQDMNLDLSIYESDEFRRYYSIVKNLSRFTINVDSNTIYYIGVKKND